MKNPKYIKFLKHTADVKFRASGKTLDSCFENAAKAMFLLMYDGKVNVVKKYKINVDGKNLEALLYKFLEELLFFIDSKDFFLSKISVKINETKNNEFVLVSEVYGDNIKIIQ